MYNTCPKAGAPSLIPLHESTQNCVEVQGQFHFRDLITDSVSLLRVLKLQLIVSYQQCRLCIFSFQELMLHVSFFTLTWRESEPLKK